MVSSPPLWSFSTDLILLDYMLPRTRLAIAQGEGQVPTGAGLGSGEGLLAQGKRPQARKGPSPIGFLRNLLNLEKEQGRREAQRRKKGFLDSSTLGNHGI